MKTVYHAYHFDLNEPDQKAAWDALKDKLKAKGLELFETHGGGTHYKKALDGATLELETSHLFENQWNTAPVEGISETGLRVFDWAKDYPSNLSGCPRYIARGHYLDQTPEMREARRNTVKCGYCGRQEPAQKGDVFCPHCIDSEYLKPEDLFLTRMRPIEDLRQKMPALSDAEREHLLPKYREAQLHGTTERGKARKIDQRKRIVEKADKEIADVKTERDGMLWLLDHGFNIDNVIFYDHTGRFGFGWRTPMSADIVSALLDAISEFPYSYDIKTADGRTLSGER